MHTVAELLDDLNVLGARPFTNLLRHLCGLDNVAAA